MNITIFNSFDNQNQIIERKRQKVQVGPEGVACPGQIVEEGIRCWIVGFDKNKETFEGIPINKERT